MSIKNLLFHGESKKMVVVQLQNAPKRSNFQKTIFPHKKTGIVRKFAVYWKLLYLIAFCHKATTVKTYNFGHPKNEFFEKNY